MDIALLKARFFPAFYETSAPRLIDFFGCYLEWMLQSNHPFWKIEHIIEVTDIDSTIDDYIEFIKNEMMVDFPEILQGDLRFVMKNIVRLYKTKGTEKAAKYFFSSVYGTFCNITYPKEWILKTNSGHWKQYYYIKPAEIPANQLRNYIGSIFRTQKGMTAEIQSVGYHAFGDSDSIEPCWIIIDTEGILDNGLCEFINGDYIGSSFTLENAEFTPGEYVDQLNLIDINSVVLQDSDYYQVYSYVIDSLINLKEYNEIYTKLFNPAGMKFFSRTQMYDPADLEVEIPDSIWDDELHPGNGFGNATWMQIFDIMLHYWIYLDIQTTVIDEIDIILKYYINTRKDLSVDSFENIIKLYHYLPKEIQMDLDIILKYSLGILKKADETSLKESHLRLKHYINTELNGHIESDILKYIIKLYYYIPKEIVLASYECLKYIIDIERKDEIKSDEASKIWIEPVSVHVSSSADQALYEKNYRNTIGDMAGTAPLNFDIFTNRSTKLVFDMRTGKVIPDADFVGFTSKCDYYTVISGSPLYAHEKKKQKHNIIKIAWPDNIPFKEDCFFIFDQNNKKIPTKDYTMVMEQETNPPKVTDWTYKNNLIISISEDYPFEPFERINIFNIDFGLVQLIEQREVSSLSTSYNLLEYKLIVFRNNLFTLDYKISGSNIIFPENDRYEVYIVSLETKINTYKTIKNDVLVCEDIMQQIYY